MKITPDHKVFCSFAFTGEDETAVSNRMRGIVDGFANLGILAYCNLDDPRIKDFTDPAEYIYHARDVMRGLDALFVVKSSTRRSEGQLIEHGIALEREMPVFVALHESAVDQTYVHKLADDSFVWNDEASLVAGIATVVRQ